MGARFGNGRRVVDQRAGLERTDPPRLPRRACLGLTTPAPSTGRHFFDEDAAGYRALADLVEVRRSRLALRRGRQYLRQISGNGVDFGLPAMVDGQLRSVVPWSRLFNDHEVLCAINTDPDQPRTAWVTIDDELHRPGEELRCVYSTDPTQRGTTLSIESRNGKAVLLTVPPAGAVVFE